MGFGVGFVFAILSCLTKNTSFRNSCEVCYALQNYLEESV